MKKSLCLFAITLLLAALSKNALAQLIPANNMAACDVLITADCYDANCNWVTQYAYVITAGSTMIINDCSALGLSTIYSFEWANTACNVGAPPMVADNAVNCLGVASFPVFIDLATSCAQCAANGTDVTIDFSATQIDIYP